jgi:hypothetical protein
MQDLFDGIQRLTALLSFRLENLAGKRAWGLRTDSYRIQPPGGMAITLCRMTLHLPRGEAGTFVPREGPEPDGRSWLIDIRRSDGVLRKSFAQGLRALPKDGTYVLFRGDEVLSDGALNEIFDDLAKPGPSGVSLWIRKMWGMRFGPMAVETSTKLEAIRDVSRLDEIHAVVLRAADKKEAEASILGE